MAEPSVTFVGTAEEILAERNRIALEVISKGVEKDLAEIEREKETKQLVKEVVKEIRSNTGRTIVSNPKVGRNQPCPCGSGEKFKKCCRKKLEGLYRSFK